MRIDAHHHLWQPARGDYDWMPDLDILTRAYAPADLEPQLKEAGIDGTVLIQAAASIEETEYMLGLADATPWIKGVVGWVDFDDRMHLAHLLRLARHPRFIGVRPMISDIEDVDWMLHDNVQWAFRALVDLNLNLDVLGQPEHIANTATLAAKHPDLRMVCDHAMKPDIAAHQAGQDAFAMWASDMAALAQHGSVYVKLSSLVTTAAKGWTIETVRPFSDHILENFGADRVMWGSDWPVCRLRTEYVDAYNLARNLTQHLSDQEQAAIFGGTAARFYNLD